MNVTISSIEDLIPEDHRELVHRFFLVFSRFEYALKRAGFSNGSLDSVHPAWEKFAAKYRSTFDPSVTPRLRIACDYFTAQPPRKQILDGHFLSWSEPQFRTNEPLFTWLLLMVRSVRNNLFHGGKFPIAPIQEPARDPDLLRHALTIIEACLPLDDDLCYHFSTDEEYEAPEKT